MSLFQRFMTVLKANLNALLGKAEDPRKILEQAIEEMQAQFMRAKEDVAHSVADEKKLAAQLEKETQQAEEWERRAVLAVNEGRDDLAAQALERQGEHGQSARQLHQAWTQHRQATEVLKKSLRDMNDRIAELRRKKNMLAARQTRAEAQTRIHSTMSTMSTGSATDTFERMEQKIEDMEASAAAAEELGSDLAGDSLERQFAALERPASSNQRLLELKRKMALAPGAESPKLLTAAAEIVDGVPASAQSVGKGPKA